MTDSNKLKFDHLAELVSLCLDHHKGRSQQGLQPYVEEPFFEELFEINEDFGSAKSYEKVNSFVVNYLKHSINTHDPKFSNQLWSKTENTSIIGEILTAFTNTSMYTYEVAPIATLLEHKMVKYLSGLIWPEGGEGLMTSGGAASNLQALFLARAKAIPSSKSRGLTHLDTRPVILVANNAHYSIGRSALVLGVGSEQIIEVATDLNGQMNLQDLESQMNLIQSDKHLNLIAVISTAGTTVEGSYDNLKFIGQLCKEHGVWLHIDGAYGASVLLADNHSFLMKGVEHADSVSWDFHKMMGLNLPAAFLFTKHRGFLRESMNLNDDSYLFHGGKNLDLGPLSLQCGRRVDILKLWISWLVNGKTGFADRIDKLFETTKLFSSMIDSDPDFKLLYSPQSINICFRFTEREKLTEEKVRNHMKQDGSALLNYSTDKDGSFFRFVSSRADLDKSYFESLLQNMKAAKNQLFR